MQKIERNNTRSLYFSERIKNSMSRVLDYPLTIVEAPMGYGKTTAVREYFNNSDAFMLWKR